MHYARVTGVSLIAEDASGLFVAGSHLIAEDASGLFVAGPNLISEDASGSLVTCSCLATDCRKLRVHFIA